MAQARRDPTHLETTELEYILHINSADCEKLNVGNTNHIRFNIAPLGNEFYDIYIQLLTATIPYSFYNINDLFRYLSIREALTSDPNDYVDIDIEIPAGNYSITQLQSQLQTSLNDATQKAVNYTITYNRITNKLTFSTDTANRTITFKFLTGNKSAVDLQNIIGFNQLDYSFTNTSSLTSVKPCNVSPYSNIFIVAPSLNITSQISSKYGNFSNILNKVPVNNIPNSFIYYENDLFIKYKSGLTRVDNIELILTDEDFDLVDIQNVNWFCSLKITLVPKEKNKIIDMLNELLPVNIID